MKVALLFAILLFASLDWNSILEEDFHMAKPTLDIKLDNKKLISLPVPASERKKLSEVHANNEKHQKEIKKLTHDMKLFNWRKKSNESTVVITSLGKTDGKTDGVYVTRVYFKYNEGHELSLPLEEFIDQFKIGE